MERRLRNQKRGQDRSYSNKCLSFVAKIVIIGPVDPEIICLRLKKKETNASKIYSSVGNLAEQAKQRAGWLLSYWKKHHTLVSACPTTWLPNSWHRHGTTKSYHCHLPYAAHRASQSEIALEGCSVQCLIIRQDWAAAPAAARDADIV